MIRINDYCSIAFAQWIRDRLHFDNLNALKDYQIDELVEDYLKENAKRWNLRLFLKLFQDYVIRFDCVIDNYRDLIATFKDFCISIENLKFIDPTSLDKRVYLYPFLQKFYEYVNARTSQRINDEFKQIAVTSYKNQKGIVEWFNEIIHFYNEELLQLFNDYIQYTFEHELKMFSSWACKKKKSERFFESTNYNQLSFDSRKYKIIEEINNGAVHNYITWILEKREKKLDAFGFITNIEEYTELDFVHYLEKKKINIFKQVPKTILEDLADEYVNRFPHANKLKIYSFIREMRDDKNFFDKIKNMFRSKYGNEFSFERYTLCKYHGVFLFRQNDNLSKFLKEYWYDIHHGTGETLDFYFTNQDINKDYHCKQWIKQYTNMEINVTEFPSIFLWEADTNNKGYILLKELTHKEIFDVIEYLTGKLEQIDFNDSLLATNSKVKQIIDSKKVIFNTYIAKDSQIGAFGYEATSNNNTFNK